MIAKNSMRVRTSLAWFMQAPALARKLHVLKSTVITRIYGVGTHLAWVATAALGGAPQRIQARNPVYPGHRGSLCMWDVLRNL